MRQISQQAAEAFFAGKNFSKSNTEVLISKVNNCAALFLFDNMIATRRLDDTTGSFFATMAGWPTRTTRDRLGALGLDISFRNREAFATDWTKATRICGYDVIVHDGKTLMFEVGKLRTLPYKFPRELTREEKIERMKNSYEAELIRSRRLDRRTIHMFALPQMVF